MTDEVFMIVLFFLLCGVAAVKLMKTDRYTRDVYIGPGTYVAGKNIPAGKVDIVAEKGGGEFCVKEHKAKDWTINQKIGATSSLQPNRFRNLMLHDGDILEVNGNVNLMLTPPVPITDVMKDSLGPGNYQFGIDVPPACYDLEVVSGDGCVTLFEPGEKEFSIFQDMAAGNDAKAQDYANLNCAKGAVLWVEGTLQLKLTHSPKTSIWM